MDNQFLNNIWSPTIIVTGTPLGPLYLCGFMNMFGAHTSYYKVLSTMQVASEAQVHYAINGAYNES
jgi:hypothetical protein